MKRNEIRALADEAYTILDDSKCEVAIERALQVLENAPEDPESYLLMCEVSVEAHKFEQALRWLDEGLSHHPHHEALLFKKASLLIDGFEDIDEAFAILIKLETGFRSKSRATLRRELGSDLLVDVYLLLADCYRLKSDYRQALEHANLAKEVAPFDQNALLAVATAHFELGDYDEAKRLIEPIEERPEASDFYWLMAQIHCAEGDLIKADHAFHKAYKLDKARYHRPVRLDENCFATQFEQALLALPREIREFVQANHVEIKDIVPLALVRESQGTLSPENCITIHQVTEKKGQRKSIISIYQRNIENLAAKKEEIKDLIASALLHELPKVCK